MNGRPALFVAMILVIAGCSRDSAMLRTHVLDAAHARGLDAHALAQRRVQVIFTEVHAGERTDRSYREDAEYFYPASTVKLVGAVCALHAARELGAALDRPIVWHDVDDPSKVLRASDGGEVILARELARMLIVSDNEAFNLCFDLASQQRMNDLMWDCGLTSVRISHRLSRSVNPLRTRTAAPLEIPTAAGTLSLPAREGAIVVPWNHPEGTKVGRAYMRGDAIVNEPMDFLWRNRISLRDLHELTIALTRPDLARAPLPLAEADRAVIQRLMGTLPRECPDPTFDPRAYPDDYGKYFLPGVARVVPAASIRIENKVGMAYGFLVDTSRIIDTRDGREFFLTVAMYVNADGVLNDDRYDYDSEGLPLMADIAERLARVVFTNESAPPR